MEEFIKYVSLAKKGDTEAFAKLYSLVYKDMYHIALYSLRNSQDASDAVSEAVLDAFSSIGNLRSVFLLSAAEEARDIDQCHQRNVECIAETYETGSLA